MRKRFLLSRLVLAVVAVETLTLVSCSKPVPPSEPLDAGRGAIGIEVSIRKPIGIGSDDAKIVYFARLEEGEGVETAHTCENVIATNFAEGGRLLLLNARPGRYAAVAASFTKQSISPPPAPGTPAQPPPTPEILTYWTYFAKDVITRTCYTIAPQTFTYVGKLEVGSSVGMKDADEAQKHFQQIIEGPIANRSGMMRAFDNEFSWRGSLLELHEDSASEASFVSKVAPKLQNSGWAAVLAQPHREPAR